MIETPKIKKYRTEFLGSILVLKLENNIIILDNRTFQYQEKSSRILRDNIKKNLTPIEQYKLIFKAINNGQEALDDISFLIWQQMR